MVETEGILMQAFIVMLGLSAVAQALGSSSGSQQAVIWASILLFAEE
jgi:hypothetical protein